MAQQQLAPGTTVTVTSGLWQGRVGTTVGTPATDLFPFKIDKRNAQLAVKVDLPGLDGPTPIPVSQLRVLPEML